VAGFVKYNIAVIAIWGMSVKSRGPTADSITVQETLDLLSGPFASLSAAFNRSEYSLWLGSGISRDRVIGLNGILHKLVEFLRTHIDPFDVTCPYRLALDMVLDHANLSPDEKRSRLPD
jgi:hypothetical protein